MCLIQDLCCCTWCNDIVSEKDLSLSGKLTTWIVTIDTLAEFMFRLVKMQMKKMKIYQTYTLRCNNSRRECTRSRRDCMTYLFTFTLLIEK